MSWKYVQRDTESGQYRTTDQGGGGGGSSTFAGLDDVSFSELQDGQIPKYNSQTQKWENADESGGGGTVTDVKVNGISVVDANNEAQIKSYKEVTQAEYQALPSSKLTDDILYCIKDSAGADGFPPLIYSDEEREIGVWRDGKPLYQKTFTSTVSSRSVEWDISTLNIETVVSQKGSLCRKYNSNNKTYWYSVDFIASADASYRAVTNVSLNDNVLTSNIDMPTGNTILYRAVTIQYTKTTDTAGSGMWTTQGGFAHHYSTNEQIVGTWIDGKPLYEKAFTKTLNATSSGGGYGEAISSSELPNAIIRFLSGYCGLMPFNGIFVKNSGSWEGYANIWGIGSNSATYNFRWGDTANADAVIIVQYTKTTD